MEFNEALKQLVADNGGWTAENLQLGAERAREIAPLFTPWHLKSLLDGYPPSDVDREAISHSFEPDREKCLSRYWHLEDTPHRDIARRIFTHIKNTNMVKEFVDYVDTRSSFRDMNLSDSELTKLLRDYQLTREPIDEIEIFDLDGSNV